MKKKSENLIVIIGNGFDLAHGLKTGFSHFADYYIENILLNNLLNVEQNKASDYFSNSFKEYINSYQQNYYFLNGSSSNSEILKTISYFSLHEKHKKDDILHYLKENIHLIGLIISNSFLGKLYSDKFDNWFDIEQSYYKELCEILKHGNNTRDSLLKLNSELEEIKKLFKKYLKEEISIIKSEEIGYSLGKHYKGRKEITIVNFNYTNTINNYLNFTLKIKNIHIHGDLNGKIIFGYGDDTDENYKKMKDAREKEFLRNFKTFHYLKDTNNRKVLNELSTKSSYDVLIIGHSLDTTDKTILKKILDNDKCDNIELLKRSDLETEQEKDEAHFELHANLSRIFDNESDLRDKLIPFEWSVNFPILTNEDLKIIGLRNNELYKKPKVIRVSNPDVY